MKKLLFSCILLYLITYSFFFPEITVNAARNGIQIWFHQILPALLPFTILSAVLIKSDFLTSFKGNASLIASLLTLVCGFVFGFPVGAKLSADFHKQGLLSERNATILSITTNNFSPMFVCGFAIPLLFSSKHYNIITYFLLYLVPLALATIYLLLESDKNRASYSKDVSPFRLNMQVMDNSIISGFESLVKICGYIVLFSIVTEILISLNIHVLPLQNIEITNGINLLSKCDFSESFKYILAIQALSLGGLSGFAQTGSILSSAGLSMHKYIIGKVLLSLLLTLLSVIYVFFIR